MFAMACVCDPVGLADIARRLGLDRGTPTAWRARYREFPSPRWTVGNYPAWDWTEDILPWLERTGRC
jgi:hypothetical protein